MAEDYDLLVLGSGEAGKYLAWTLASQGKKVAVIERRYVGGSCPNIACLPSKNTSTGCSSRRTTSTPTTGLAVPRGRREVAAGGEGVLPPRSARYRGLRRLRGRLARSLQAFHRGRQDGGGRAAQGVGAAD